MRILLVASLVIAGVFGAAGSASAHDDICVEVDVYGTVNVHPTPICVPYSGVVVCDTLKLGEPSSPVFYGELTVCTPD